MSTHSKSYNPLYVRALLDQLSWPELLVVLVALQLMHLRAQLRAVLGKVGGAA